MGPDRQPVIPRLDQLKLLFQQQHQEKPSDRVPKVQFDSKYYALLRMHQLFILFKRHSKRFWIAGVHEQAECTKNNGFDQASLSTKRWSLLDGQGRKSFRVSGWKGRFSLQRLNKKAQFY